MCVCKAEAIPGEEMEICRRNEGEKSWVLSCLMTHDNQKWPMAYV